MSGVYTDALSSPGRYIFNISPHKSWFYLIFFYKQRTEEIRAFLMCFLLAESINQGFTEMAWLPEPLLPNSFHFSLCFY